jgi:hypothetical protein
MEPYKKTVVLAVSAVFFLLLAGFSFAFAERCGSGVFYALFGTLLAVGIIMLWRVRPDGSEE